MRVSQDDGQFLRRILDEQIGRKPKGNDPAELVAWRRRRRIGDAVRIGIEDAKVACNFIVADALDVAQALLAGELRPANPDSRRAYYEARSAGRDARRRAEIAALVTLLCTACQRPGPRSRVPRRIAHALARGEELVGGDPAAVRELGKMRAELEERRGRF